MFADLHLHTRFSDGTFTPEELVENAARAGLRAIALTDHDTMDGCPRAASACAGAGLEFIPGTELTAEHDGQELHLLGYWLDLGAPGLADELRHFQQVRQRRIAEMVARLNEQGIPLTAQAVLELANCESPGRPHLARALVAGGHVRDYDTAFDKYLKKGRPGWVPKARLEASRAIDLIHRAGGVAVLAHPVLYRQDSLIPKLAAEGIDGLECWHTKQGPEASARYVRLAGELGLVATGGSDCHGNSKGPPLIGTLRIPYEQVETLRARRPTTTTTTSSAASGPAAA